MPHYPEDIEYSDKYQDDFYEYRHVILPKHIFKKITRGILIDKLFFLYFIFFSLRQIIDRNGMESIRCTIIKRLDSL